jgi:molybdopterin/thiamine biosynthesis adenylyltransferase
MRIQEKDDDFYKQFHVVVCGLDSIEARRWLNTKITSFVEYKEQPDGKPAPNMETVIPIVDGGTEGFKGNARVIIPTETACVECTLDLFPPQVCKLASREDRGNLVNNFNPYVPCRLATRFAQLHTLQDFQSTVLNMFESYNGQESIQMLQLMEMILII